MRAKKGAINIQRCSAENQKGTIAVECIRAIAPFWFSTEHLWIFIRPSSAILALNWCVTVNIRKNLDVSQIREKEKRFCFLFSKGVGITLLERNISFYFITVNLVILQNYFTSRPVISTFNDLNFCFAKTPILFCKWSDTKELFGDTIPLSTIVGCHIVLQEQIKGRFTCDSDGVPRRD